METDVMQVLAEAAANHQWAVVAAAAVVVVVPIVLKAFGKEVPLLEPALKGILGVVKGLAGKKPEPAKEPEGLAAVVKIEDAPTKKQGEP